MSHWVDTAATRRSTRHSERRAAQRQQIVEAAAAAIEELGLNVGTAEIAQRAGVARPHVYRHFDSKDDLDDAVANRAATELVERVRPTMTRTGTPPEIVGGVVREAVAWAAEHPNLYRFMAARQQTKAMHRARMGRTRFLDEIVHAATAYLRSRDIDQEAPDGILAGLMGMADASIIWWLDHRDESQEAVVERVTRQAWLILSDMLRQLGLPISDDTVLELRPPDEA
jgi:AcrR family transcriptional regulator